MTALTGKYERAALDWYVEPADVTEALLAVEHFSGAVLDPACGLGTIPKAVSNAGLNASGSDVVDRRPRGEWSDAWAHGWKWFLNDFLRDESPRVQNIITNPPFGRGDLAMAFIEKAHAVADHKIAVFVDLRFIASAKRAGFFSRFKPERIWILVPRPSCPPGELLQAGEIKRGGGAQDYCWLIFRPNERPAATEIRWLDRKKKAEVT